MNNNAGNYVPYAAERRLGARMTFSLVDVNAVPSVLTATSSNQLMLSEINQTFDGIETASQKWATIEPEGWILDGSYGFLSETEDNGEVGWWSNNYSNSSGVLSTTAYLQITSSANLNSNAITIVFDELTDNYCTDFQVIWYALSGGSYTAVKTVNVTDNQSAVAIVKAEVNNYRRVRINFTGTNKPNRFVRVMEVVFGELQMFGDDRIKDINFRYETSLYSESLPSNELYITVDNHDKAYNLINPTGIYKYLMTGQGINVSIFINGTQIHMGRFYFSGSKSADNSVTAQITGYDRNFLLDSVNYNNGRSGTWTVAEAVADVITASGLRIETDIPSTIASRTVKRDIPRDTSCREALRLIAQAARSLCYFSRLDILTFIEPIVGNVVDVLNYDRMTSYPEAEDTGLINYVELTVRSDYSSGENTYIASDITGDEVQQSVSLDNPCAYEGQAVADWILAQCKYRLAYSVDERGNPARELEDTIQIFDAYGNSNSARVISEEFTLNTGLSGRTKAVTLLNEL